ncbi:MAG: hypothetical protein EBR09_02665 [Proteobacteria bacterium]|nr:hypothetical protein [Pseudomonadota bacterium]
MEKKFSFGLGLYSLAVLGLGNACGPSQSTFTAVQKVGAPKPVVDAKSGDQNGNAVKPKQPAPVIGIKDPVQPSQPAAGEKKLVTASEKFEVSASSPPSDFVFVVDGSRSMETLIGKIMDGFETINSADYPPDTKMAVMNMLSHKLDNPSEALAAESIWSLYSEDLAENNRTDFRSTFTLENVKLFLDAQPGYLKFINSASVAAYKQKADTLSYSYKYNVANSPTITEKLERLLRPGKTNSTYPLPVCQNAWFTPTETNEYSQRCLRAAMQINEIVHIESGLTAVHQMLKKNKAMPLFRDKAAVHFVFISDTHDPGDSGFANFTGYMEKLPKFADIESAARETSTPIRSVKLHGVVPFTADNCADNEYQRGLAKSPQVVEPQKIFGGSYLPQITASGGVAVDMCKSNIDYKSVVNQILSEAKKIPPFKLNAADVKNVVVKVNGMDYKEFQVVGGNSVEVNGLLSNTSYTIEIAYTHETM